jgi:hypothetical protein
MFIDVLLVRRRTSAAAPQSNCHGLYQNIDVENASCWVVLRAGNSGSWSTVETGPMILPQQPRPARRPDFHRRIPLLRSPFWVLPPTQRNRYIHGASGDTRKVSSGAKSLQSLAHCDI